MKLTDKDIDHANPLAVPFTFATSSAAATAEQNTCSEYEAEVIPRPIVVDFVEANVVRE